MHINARGIIIASAVVTFMCLLPPSMNKWTIVLCKFIILIQPDNWNPGEHHA